MRWGRLVGLVTLALLAGIACEDEATTPDESAAGEAGAPAPSGGIAGSASTHGGAGAGHGGAGAEHGGAGAGHGGAGAGGACEGDAALWASLTAAPPECESDDDCCVVVNSCLAEAQIVHVTDFEVAQAAWPYCEADCTDCIPPVVRVSCDNGHCVGKIDNESLDDGVSHCGDAASAAGSPGQSFSCGGG